MRGPNGRNRDNYKDEMIRVCIRMRPLLAPYEDEEVWNADDKAGAISTLSHAVGHNASYLDVSSMSSASLRERDLRRRYSEITSQNFKFDNVFSQEINTQKIYHTVGRPITQSVLDGYNGTIFMYGQTTSGKTFTMLGSPESPGVLPCAIRDVFQGIKRDTENDYSVWISYLEIYNEQINDLLSPGTSNLKIKEDPKYGVMVSEAKKQQVWTFDQVIILMNYGEEHRIYRETSIHEHSSRSHTIFKVYIESIPKNDEAQR
eukprot:CAMPEP_0115016942 /NCGR_PEP_ID=MMETSP0216-20121206/27785_1 /TAXON_ID=223996 /ORGANISM="Protocruzia adherens, Strain Boccale" /LENGTH=259 /DNA_ID=CAMNT_0002387591 /DNA_START=38 /DNA_END=814 /DNA_ORIENTATION=+